MHYPLANTNELVYFFQIRKLMEKPIEIHIHISILLRKPPKMYMLRLSCFFV